MANLGAVQVRLELGHRAQVRKKATVEGFTHDWMVFVRGPEHSDIQHFVDKVVFHLHESFPRPKRVCKDPPYRVEESGYAGFILPIEVYFRNKEEPKKVRFDYDLFLHLEGHPPVNHLRCEKLTFNNPTEEFRRKLLKAGGQRDPHRRSADDPKMVVLQEGSTRQHPKPLALPNSSAPPTFADSKSKNLPSSKAMDPSRGSGGASLSTTSASITGSSGFSKHPKLSKDQRHKREAKGASRDSVWEASQAPKDAWGRPRENQPLQDINAKIGFKQSKTLSRDPQSEDEDLDSVLSKRPSGAAGDHHPSKKRKTGLADLWGRGLSTSDSRRLEKVSTDRFRARKRGPHAERGTAPALPPVREPVHTDHSDPEDQPRSDSEQPSPASSASSPGGGATLQKRLDQHSDVNDEDPEEEQDRELDSDEERLARAHLSQRPRRVAVSLSDGCESNGSSPSPPSHSKAPPSLRTAHHQAYLEELVDLHKRLMALREGRVLQQIVNLIEETGHFHISNTTFDFDLCSLDRSTVRKLQSYLEASGPS